jgi:hypothetical protein
MNKKVALCLFGQPRWLENPYTYESLNKWILSKYQVDIYMHSWITPSTELSDSYFNGGSWLENNVKGKELPNSKEILLEKYKPKKYKFEKQKYFNHNFQLNNISRYKFENELPIFSHIYSMNQSIEMIENIHYYDFIIITRYDVYIREFPNLDNIFDKALWLDTRYKHFCDVIMLATPDFAEKLLVRDNLDEIIKNINVFTPEDIKQCTYYFYTNIEPKRIKMDAGFVRSIDLEKVQF